MYLASLLEAEDVVEVEATCWTMDVGEPIRVSEAPVVIVGEEAFEQLVGIVDRGDVLFPQVFDEAILMRPIGSFDTPFGLRRMGVNKVHTKPGHSQAEGC